MTATLLMSRPAGGGAEATILAAPGAIAWFRFDKSATAHTWTDVIGGKVFTGVTDPTLNATGYHFDRTVPQYMTGAAGMMSGMRYYTIYLVCNPGSDASVKVVLRLGASEANAMWIAAHVQSVGMDLRIFDAAVSPDQWGMTALDATLAVWDMYGDKQDAVHPTNPFDKNDSSQSANGGYDDTQAGSGNFENATWSLAASGDGSSPCDLQMMDILICASATDAAAKHSAGVRSPIVAAFRSLRGV